MLTFFVKPTNHPEQVITVNVPTELSDITPEYLKGVTDNIEVAEHYALIAICYREKLSTLTLAYRNKNKETQAAVIPTFVKAGKTDNSFINNISCGDKLVIGGSDIALGYHVNAAKNQISIDRIMEIFEQDKSYYTKLIGNTTYCYFVDFKLVPINTIHGAYNNELNDYVPPFVKVDYYKA